MDVSSLSRKALTAAALMLTAVASAGLAQEMAFLGKVEGATAEEIRTDKRKLAEVKERFDDARQRVVVISSQFDDLERERRDNVQAQEKIESEITRSKERLASVQAELTRLTGELEEATTRFTAAYQDFSRRLAAIHEMRSYPLVGFVLRSGSFSEFMRRYQYARVLTSFDLRKMEELSALQGQIEEKRKSLASEQKKVEQLRDEKRQKNQGLQQAISKGQEILDKLRLERVSALSRASSLEKYAREMEETIKEQETKRIQELARKDTADPATPAEQQANGRDLVAGRLGWPLDGDMEVVRPFGTVRRGNQPEYFNPGIDVRIVGLRTVKAVEAGRVIHQGRLPSFGKVLMIDHGGRGAKIISVYGNLDSIMVAMGQWVRRGDPVALVGQGTGQGGTEAQLHLEIRKNAEPLDPLVWLER